MTCPHVGLTADAAAVSQVPPRGATRVECPCCHLGGYFEVGDTIAGMTCPYCEVQGVVSCQVSTQGEKA